MMASPLYEFTGDTSPSDNRYVQVARLTSMLIVLR